MRIEKLRNLYNSCRANAHYQFRELSEADLLISAKKAFSKLTEKQKETVAKSWHSYLVRIGEKPTQDSADELLKLRYLAQTNLYFLCHLLEKYSQTTAFTHEEICNDFFTRKDPTYLTFEQFANSYTDLKEKLLLVPRGGFKSSIDMADCIQWFICFPSITVLILTGVYRLARDFVGEVRKHCTLEETGELLPNGKPAYGPAKLQDKETGEWSDSCFQVLFPEHCIKPGEGTELEFQTPAADDDKEPTIQAGSIEQALVGSHYCVMKLDDVVTNENSKNINRIKDVNKQISINKAMLHPFGFFDVIGTWYDENDFYGSTIKREEKFAIKNGYTDNIKGSVDSGRFNSSVQFKVYLRACWWPNEAAIAAGKIEEELKKEDYVLWFPERLNYEFLIKEQMNDTDEDQDGDTGYFAIKYLNNPRKINKVKFPKELLLRRTIPHREFPGQGIMVTTIDTAYSTKAWADYTVILTALIHGGRFYIVNMVRGRFNEFELPSVIANTAFKWKPRRIAIEDSVGVKWMSRELRREMDKLRISIPVEFCSLGFGSKLRSKMLKAKPVLRLLGDERMYFLNSCEGLEEIYNEMEKFTGTSDDAHDDIVSALSLMTEQFGGYADMDARVNSVNMEYIASRQDQARHDLIYGLGKYSRYNSNNSIDENPVTTFEREQSSYSQAPPYNDPFRDLF